MDWQNFVFLNYFMKYTKNERKKKGYSLKGKEGKKAIALEQLEQLKIFKIFR